MKKILFILSFLIPFLVNAQVKVKRASANVWIQDARLQVPLNFTIPVYADTASANSSIGLDSLGAFIQLRSTGQVYHRDTTTGGHKWTEFATNTGTGMWGSIGGTISTQTDLQAQFATKQATIALGTSAQYFRGDLSLATFPTDLASFTNGPGYVTSLNSTNSIVGDGTVATPFKLSGDVASPGANKVYGTDGGGSRTWTALSSILGLDPVLAYGDTAYQKQLIISWDAQGGPVTHEFFAVYPDSTNGFLNVGDVNGNRTNFFLIMSQRSVGFEADSGLLIKAGGNTQFTQLMTQAAQSGTTKRLKLPNTGNLIDTIATKFDIRTAAFDSTSLSTRINLKTDSVKRIADSVFYYHNGTKSFAFLDSFSVPSIGGIDTTLAKLQTFTTDRKIGGGQHKFTIDSVSSLTLNTYGVADTTFNEGIILENKTPVNGGNLYEWSPAVHLVAHAYASSADKKVEWREYVKPYASGMSYTPDLVWEQQTNGGGWTERMRLWSNGNVLELPFALIVGTSTNTTITAGGMSTVSIGASGSVNFSNAEVGSGPYNIATPVTTITGGTFTATLPPVTIGGIIYRIVNIGSGTTTVGTTSSQNITNGLTTATTWTLTQGKFVEVVSGISGSNYWIVVSSN